MSEWIYNEFVRFLKLIKEIVLKSRQKLLSKWIVGRIA